MATNAVIDIPELGEISVAGVVNRNERRVRERLPVVLREFPDFPLDRLMLQDAYALALNFLAPRYTQAFSIVLHEPIQQSEIDDALRTAIQRVQAYPKS
ncbi:MAG: late competence development ComFB family protein [Desulfohalobium sp.]